MRLKSPGTENTSATPIWTRRRARWRPSVASDEAIVVDGVEEFCTHETTSLLAGLCVSKDPIFVAMMVVVVVGGGVLRWSENWKEKERERMVEKFEVFEGFFLVCLMVEVMSDEEGVGKREVYICKAGFCDACVCVLV